MTDDRPDLDAPIVVVGVDGSLDAYAALSWAAAFAGRFGAVIHAVHVWTPGSRLADSPRQAVARTAEIVRELGAPPTAVVPVVVEGAPGRMLVEHSRDAILLVVGATGRARYPRPGPARVGATARYATRHALCPVTVIGRNRRPELIEELPTQPWIPYQPTTARW